MSDDPTGVSGQKFLETSAEATTPSTAEPKPVFTNNLSQEERNRIAEILTERTKGVCPMCGHNTWFVVDGYSRVPMHKVLIGQPLGGPGIPTIAAVCKTCGFIAEYAAGILGLMPEQTK